MERPTRPTVEANLRRVGNTRKQPKSSRGKKSPAKAEWTENDAAPTSQALEMHRPTTPSRSARRDIASHQPSTPRRPRGFSPALASGKAGSGEAHGGAGQRSHALGHVPEGAQRSRQHGPGPTSRGARARCPGSHDDHVRLESKRHARGHRRPSRTQALACPRMTSADTNPTPLALDDIPLRANRGAEMGLGKGSEAQFRPQTRNGREMAASACVS